MLQIARTLSELSGCFDGEDPQFSNPDEKPEGLGVSLSQLQRLTEVDSPLTLMSTFQIMRRFQIMTAESSAEKEQRGTCRAGRHYRPCSSTQIRPQFRARHTKFGQVVHTETSEALRS